MGNRGKKFIALMAGITALISSSVFAHPPREIKMEYDAVQKILKIDMEHVSRNHTRHYIRKIVVTVNDRPPMVEYYRQQVNPAHFTVEIPLEAKGGDKIAIQAYSSEGGIQEASIDVPVTVNPSTIPAQNDGVSSKGNTSTGSVSTLSEVERVEDDKENQVEEKIEDGSKSETNP